jgi:DNA replication and repair protein RecF
MRIKNLNILNFKNYEEESLEFSQGVNIFTGNNGSGKTNLLDAIHFLSMTKSAFHTTDSQSLKRGENFFSISGTFSRNDKDYLISTLFQGGKKVFQADKKAYEKITDHIGRFPIILVTPYDTDLIREGSEERRKFFDSLFSQIDKHYLIALIRYNHVLKQRNSLLKQFAEKRYTDFDLLESYDGPILEEGFKIFRWRKAFIQEFLPLFNQSYDLLTHKNEVVSFNYQSDVSDPDFELLFKNSVQKDLVLERTTKGIHKDDYQFLIEGQSVKTSGSQGQQKSYVLALKLASYQLLANYSHTRPILLLDDIFDKLDEERITSLLKIIDQDNFGQIMITEAKLERSWEYFKNIRKEIRIFNISKGKILSVKNA